MQLSNYNDCVCEVKNLENNLIATGTLRAVSEDMLEVQDSGSHLPLLTLDTKVKLIIHNTEKGTQVLAGRVYISAPAMMRVRELESFAEHDHRRFFRLAIDHSATLIIPVGMTDKNGRRLPPKLPVRVKDLSLCGLLFESYQEFSIGDELRINMTMVRNQMETLRIVIRRELKRDRENVHAYGCELKELSPMTEQHVNAYVLEQQQLQIRKSRGNGRDR